MSRVFVDTSALLALLVPTDGNHAAAKEAFDRLQAEVADLVTTSYVLVETYALLGRRFGSDAVRAFRASFAPLLRVVWIDHELHERALDRLLADSVRGSSLVDAASFVVARAQRIQHAWAYDRHFTDAGFHPVR